MITYLVRIWLPDRPGALGQVASRIGAVRGDVVGIEILERDGGQAVDELAVALPDATLVNLLVQEIGQVEGVSVEDVRAVAGEPGDGRIDALDTAARMVEAPNAGALLEVLVRDTVRELDADWGLVVDLSTQKALAEFGEWPAVDWLAAFIEGARHSDMVMAGHVGPEDIAFASLAAFGAEVVLGRRGRPFRTRERRQLIALVRVANSTLDRLGWGIPAG
ncbi:MAG: hypothetical protein AB7L13_06960 [Acidimicrobiia bacterium]